MTERSQIALVWLSLVLTAVYGGALIFLFDMFPPPDATLGAADIARFYAERATEIKVGAMLAGWTSASLFPMWFVVGVQIRRIEGERPVWGPLAQVSGGLTSIFLVLPPLLWGAAAFSPDRPAEITKAIHEVSVLTLVCTDQYFIFLWISLCVACLLPKNVPYSPFPRWFGYFNIWLTLMFEAGVFGFYFKSGPFSWNGLFPFWLPFGLFGVWIPLTAYLLIKACRLQAKAAERDADSAPSEVRV